jgi:hypothetical protein
MSFFTFRAFSQVGNEVLPVFWILMEIVETFGNEPDGIAGSAEHAA